MIGSVIVHDEFRGSRPARGIALIVEDDDAVRRMVERHLARAGFSVRTANGERDALPLVRNVDVVVVDLGLAEGNGADLCDRIREDPATASLPIIVLTARDDLATKLQLFAAGVDDYLTKPFEPLELLARIEVAERRAGPRDEWRRLGPLEISEGGDAMLNHISLSLTAAERQLMSRLAASYPGAASHESLRHGAWRRSDTSSANVIEVIAGRIRKKLAAAGGGVEIRAVRGVGYAMYVSRGDPVPERMGQ